MKRSILSIRQIAATLIVFSFFSMLNSCQELEDLLHHPQKHSQESAEVIFDWYELIIHIQLHQTPSPVVPLNFRNLGFIGIGLYESIRPGIKGAGSLSSKLYQMPAMPEPEADKGYVWGASANAALASMFKHFLTGLTDADLARIDSMENAYNQIYRYKSSEADFTRSQDFGRNIASSIYDWAATDNFNLSNVGYKAPEFPGSWVPTPPAFANPFGP